MAIKLLESLPSTGNEVHQQIDDGAIMNFHITHNLNGAIYGAKLINTTNTISISAGLLMVRGFRLKIDRIFWVICRESIFLFSIING